VTSQRLVHHELCFGCGRTNLFGLLMEIEQTGEGAVRGRGFVKQDHQGPARGSAHPGIVAAALSEAIAFAAGDEINALEIQLHAPVPVGTFIEVEAHVEPAPGGERTAIATAWVDQREVASACAAYRG
jgi:hypothetical protein